MTSRLICALAVGLSASLSLVGCNKADKGQAAAPETYTPPTYTDEDVNGQSTVTEGMAAASTSAYRTTVDAMVGQINGRPVYASEIFSQVGEDTLQRSGAALPRREFRKDVIGRLQQHLMARVQSELILAEAERDLSPQEQLGLLGMIRIEREKIFAMFGGSEAEAREGIRARYGDITLEEYLEGKRQQVLVEKYLHEKLYPKINVTRRDVERYYQAHHAEFNPSPSIRLRLIIVDEKDAADKVDEALANGTPFEQVAKEQGTRFASRGGLLSPFESTVKDFKGLRWPALNDQVRTLKVGEHSGRTKIDAGYAWVKLEGVIGGDESETLTDAYPRIENTLRGIQMDQLSRKYNAELFKKGNFTPLEDMLVSLVDIAMARYARPE